MTLGSPHARLLAAGGALAASAMLLTHPLAVAVNLLLAVGLVWKSRLWEASRAIVWAAAGIGVAVLVFNAAFAWRGATVLWLADFRIALFGRPRLTVEAIAWGATAAGQLAATVLALGAATVAVPPETLNRAMERAGLPASLARAAGLALRLVPDTTRDAHAMRDALKTRGVDPASIRGASRTLVPLAARSLDRAMVAEEALLVRGFDPANRETGWPPAAWLALAGLLAAGFVAFVGPGRPSFYPQILVPWDPVSLAWIGLALAVPAVLVGEVKRCSS